MRIFATKEAYYVKGQTNILKASKKDSSLTILESTSPELTELDASTGCGEVICVLGKLDIDEGDYLLVVTHITEVAKFHANELMHPIYRIDRVKAISLADDGKIVKPELSNANVANSNGSTNNGPAAQAASKLRFGQRALMKFVQDKIPGNQSSLLEQVLRLFNDRPDFFFCFERDITHCTQKFFGNQHEPDERFFWNRQLLDDLYSNRTNEEIRKEWIVPIMQGHVQSRDLSLLEDFDNPAVLRITIISRRSVHRAGMRYLRRGIDTESKVANFVETELLLNIFEHHLSFVQIRGSVPVFWSQKGYKYRPPLTIDRSIEESLPYFATHCSELLSLYGSPIVMVNLVDQTGRELKLATSYLEHVLKQDSPDILFYSFDFHNHCRGLKFDKVNDLISSLEKSLSTLGFCWVDRTGEVVRCQTGVVRTNCVDCLDRTNVLQGAISQWICMQQAQRLGLFGPLSEPPESLVQTLQTMWADNGDSISTQYAGTAALKGDVTRCGERKLTGIMKDGYNSASRYYLSHVRDATRQKAINALLKIESEEISTDSDSESDEDENVGRLVSETTHFLLPENEVLVGGWALVDSQNTIGQVDTVLLLTRTNIYIALYDDDSEKLLEVRIVPFNEVEELKVGCTSRSPRIHLRVVSKQGSWAWRAANTRLFNNVAIRIKNEDEADEYVESIGEQLRVTIEMTTGRDIPLDHPQRVSIGRENKGKVIANMVSSVFGVGRRRNQHPESLVSPIISETSAALTAVPNIPESFNRSSSAEPPKNYPHECTVVDRIEESSGIRPSVSDCRLVDRFGASGLVSKLKGLRAPLFKGDASASPSNPFGHLLQQIEKANTHVYLL